MNKNIISRVLLATILILVYACNKNEPLDMAPPTTPVLDHTPVIIISDPNVFPIYAETYVKTVYTSLDVPAGMWNGWETPPGAVNTGTVGAVTAGAPEGNAYMKMVDNYPRYNYWGGGWFKTAPGADLSAWAAGTLRFKAKGTADMSGVQVTVFTTTPTWATLSSFGYAADSAWHDVTVPLSTFGAATMTNVLNFAVFRNGTGTLSADGGEFCVDFVRYVK